MVVSDIFYFHPYLGKISNLTTAIFFQMGWFNHPLVSQENHSLFPGSCSESEAIFICKNHGSWRSWIRGIFCGTTNKHPENLQTSNRSQLERWWFSTFYISWEKNHTKTIKNSREINTCNCNAPVRWWTNRCLGMQLRPLLNGEVSKHLYEHGNPDLVMTPKKNRWHFGKAT